MWQDWFHNVCLVCNSAGALPEASERVAAAGPRKRHVRALRMILQRVSFCLQNSHGTLYKTLSMPG